MKSEDTLRREIFHRVEQIFIQRKKRKKFIPGKTWVQYAGGVFDHREINASIASLIDGWFGLGKYAEALEQKLAAYIGTKGSILTNSGSSSNLLAVTSLLSPFSPYHLKPGDEVVTSACGFPTTVNPLFQTGLVPVFVDIDPHTYNPTVSSIEQAITDKTRAIVIAHTLGNPNEMDGILELCNKYSLLLIEDNCDALGSEYRGKKTGSFGILATQSFYPPHHITMGEGGAVLYSDMRFERIIRSLRDWGRACWCRGDEKRTLGACGVRFSFKLDDKLYDHKYIFHQIGYNLKPIEPQAAMGVVQVDRIELFGKKRRENFARLLRHASRWKEYFYLPKATKHADPSWFSFPLTIREDVGFSRFDITMFLEQRMIQTRPLFAGNITKQPAYKNSTYRIVGDLGNATRVLHNTFFVGVYPGLGNEEIDYIAQSIDDFLVKHVRASGTIKR